MNGNRDLKHNYAIVTAGQKMPWLVFTMRRATCSRRTNTRATSRSG